MLCPVSLLEQVVLTLESYDTNGIPTTTTIPDFKLYDDDWSEYNFQVPENMSYLIVTLALKIKIIASGEYQSLSSAESFRNERYALKNLSPTDRDYTLFFF